MRALDILDGPNDHVFYSCMFIAFDNMSPLFPQMSVVKVDKYDGVRYEEIERDVVEKLEKSIIPSKTTSMPAVPNFLGEHKGPDGSMRVKGLQATTYGAFGARAMLMLQNYDNPIPKFDGKAYTFTTTFHCGYLGIYATYPSAPTMPGGPLQYHQTLVNTYGLHGSIETFQNGAAAYRNAKEWCKEQRDRMVLKANKIARAKKARSTNKSQGTVDYARPLATT